MIDDGASYAGVFDKNLSVKIFNGLGAVHYLLYLKLFKILCLSSFSLSFL